MTRWDEARETGYRDDDAVINRCIVCGAKFESPFDEDYCPECEDWRLHHLAETEEDICDDSDCPFC